MRGVGRQVRQPVIGGCFGAFGPFDQQRDVGQDTVPQTLLRGGGGLGKAAGPDTGRPHRSARKRERIGPREPARQVTSVKARRPWSAASAATGDGLSR
ncbi:hypothetical protein SGFS_081390 [Streptomyces graminofaciens]|uniref:Uncharacterized protein n=1 Tax=Streptomyces graminofaciens TaxID=68212 RepID=A0ABN5VW71_9ACTN|nr:hypothetical protein SGFS_081390 [Streptomyces graminofaciens]